MAQVMPMQIYVVHVCVQVVFRYGRECTVPWLAGWLHMSFFMMCSVCIYMVVGVTGCKGREKSRITAKWGSLYDPACFFTPLHHCSSTLWHSDLMLWLWQMLHRITLLTRLCLRYCWQHYVTNTEWHYHWLIATNDAFDMLHWSGATCFMLMFYCHKVKTMI